MNKKRDSGLFLSEKTGALLMLNTEERRLIKELLSMALKSENVRIYIIKRLGKEYLQVGATLFKNLGS